MGGKVGYLAGLAAEGAVAAAYERDGQPVAARRWRGQHGEIDLVARDGDTVVFVEVKKGRTHAGAMEALGWRQIRRIWNAASEFLDGEPKGSLTDVRFDVALVDAFGRIEIRRNAFA
jgi:putative endonuclease